jgi:hypothetical protein
MMPVQVAVQDEKPIGWSIGRRYVEVREVTDVWREQGRWWDGERECEFFLVLTDLGLRLLMHDLPGNEWYVKPVR